MTVEEIIAKLQELDPKKYIATFNERTGRWEEIVDVIGILDADPPCYGIL